jgi:hypothetical protein
LRASLATLFAVLLLAGCTDDKQPAAPAPTATSTASAPDVAVEQVMIRVSDLPEGGGVVLIPGGDQVAGQVTLDECDYPFTTEAMRVARRQVGVTYPGEGAASYSNEVVAYDTEAHAELALKEWRTAVRECPEDEFRDSAVDGVPAVRTKLLEFHSLDSLPIRNNTVARQLVTARRGRSLYLAVVYQQHGELLDANYLSTTVVPTEAQIARLTEQAHATGRRLAALPGGDAA